MDYLSHVLTFLAGLGAGWTLKIFVSNRSSRKSRTTFANQTGNSVGGDMAAGDINKNNKV
ncbi:hypothetical protein C9422_09775 [Pseudomonas sp. B1(2018)]|nr:hypothetical protein C9422_09775 [Pseudomonas sp. B1(2018)]